LATVVAEAVSTVTSADIDELRATLANIVRAAQEADASVPVAVAARQLGVTGPTIRSWTDRGILTAVPDVSPARVTVDSLGRTLAAVTELREADGSGPLQGRLLDVLHDWQTRLELVDRLADLEHGEWRAIDVAELDELFAT